MNRRQRIALIISFIVVLGMAIFPPWRIVYDIPGEDLGYMKIPKGRIERSGGYKFLLTDHDTSLSTTVTVNSESTTAYVTRRIDYYRLATQISVVLLLTGMAYLILRTKDVP